MTAFLRGTGKRGEESKRRRTYQVKVYEQATKIWRQRTTGTRHRPTSRQMQRMLNELGPEGSRAFDLLDVVLSYRITVAELYDAWRLNALDELRARLSDVDLEPQVAKWRAWLDADEVEPDTAQHYEHAVRTLIREGQPYDRSEFTGPVLDAWLAEVKGKAATRRKHGAAMRSFSAFLVRRGILATDPMAAIALPVGGAARDRWLEPHDLVRLAEKQEEPYRTLSALMGGTGIELSVALRLTRRDIDLERRTIRARGTKTRKKTTARDRVVRVAEWAWPYIERTAKRLLPDVRLFAAIEDRWDARDKHVAAVAALVADGFTHFDGYQARDHRHSYSVRQAKSGVPVEVTSAQLGHVDTTMASKVYRVYQPQLEELDKWERVATARDKHEEKRRKSEERKA